MVRNIYIILNYKTYLLTETLVDELLTEGIGNDRIIVVDNASPNDAASYLLARYNDVDCVDIVRCDENGGFARGNNTGLRFAKRYSPQYVTIINNDVHFSTAVTSELIDRYQKLPDAGVIAPIQVDKDGREVDFQELKLPDLMFDIRSYMFFFGNKRHKYQDNCPVACTQRVGIIPGAFMFTDYAWFEAAGFFDESTFLYCEERFLGKKVLDRGRHCYIATDCTYIHDHGSTVSKLYDRQAQGMMIFEGRKQYIRKYRRASWLQIAILTLFYHFHILIEKIRARE